MCSARYIHIPSLLPDDSVSVLILHSKKEIQALWSQNYDTEIIHCNAVRSRPRDAMPLCQQGTGYGKRQPTRATWCSLPTVKESGREKKKQLKQSSLKGRKSSPQQSSSHIQALEKKLTKNVDR